MDRIFSLNSKKKLTPGVILTLFRGYIYMTFVVKQAYWCISQISDERLQDHWSAGIMVKLEYIRVYLFFFFFLWVLVRTATCFEHEIKNI